uniref:OSIGBa0142I02-OSIGBa0101B20.11 protein n=1 Tax=Oryza sativa TaxID=4530 RepID=Q01HH8_ORYSA|nr:OSIGBa0142I02-OSIGBa0101B20.11 [Oryza sativa]
MDPWYIRKSIAPLLLAKHSSRTSSSAVNGGSISSGAADSTTLARSTAARRIHLTTPSCFDNNDDSGRLAVLSSFDDNDRYLVAPRHGQAKRPVRRRHEKHLDARLGDASESKPPQPISLVEPFPSNQSQPKLETNPFYPLQPNPLAGLAISTPLIIDPTTRYS